MPSDSGLCPLFGDNLIATEPEKDTPLSLLDVIGGQNRDKVHSSNTFRTVLAVGRTNVGLFLMTDQPEPNFNGLFDELRSPLRRYILFLGLSPEDADDVVQETFFRLHKHFQAQGDRTNLQGWLFEVARNLVRDHRKSVWKRVLRSLEPGARGLSLIEGRAINPEESLLSQEKLSRMRAAVDRLTPQQRECLQLRVAGLRYRQIAEVMGVGISAVGELMQRATKRLSEDIQ